MTEENPTSKSTPPRKRHTSLIFWPLFIVVLIVLELTLFNLPYWQTMGLEPQQITTQQPLAKDESYKASFTPPRDIQTLRISTSKSCRVQLEYFDEGSSVLPTQVTHDVYLEVPSTQFLQFHAYGRVNAINLKVDSLLDPRLASEDEEEGNTEANESEPVTVALEGVPADAKAPEDEGATAEDAEATEADAAIEAETDADANVEEAEADTYTEAEEAEEEQLALEEDPSTEASTEASQPASLTSLEEATNAPLITFSLTVNQPMPFNFSWLRILAILGLALIIWGFAPRRRIYRLPLFHESAHGHAPARLTRLSRGVLIALTAALCIMAILPLGINPVKHGSFGDGYSSVTMVEHLNRVRAQDKGYIAKGASEIAMRTESTADQPEPMMQPYTDTSSLAFVYPRYYEAQYARLARSFAEGKLYLLDEPYPEYLEMEHPYDKGARDDLIGTDANYYWDTAYYEGHFYVYFGVLPTLVFYLPYFLVTGQDLPNAIPVAICLVAIMAGLASLLTQIARRWFPQLSLGAMIVCLVLVFLGAQFGWLTLMPRIYEIPVAMALALLVWAASCFVSLDRHPNLVILGSLLVALIFACRPQIGLFGLLLAPFGIQALMKHRSRGARAYYLASALAPIVIVFVLLGVYNAARFGNPLDFGANYNLTTNDMRFRPFTIEMGLMSLFAFFVELPDLQPQLPFFFPLLSTSTDIAANELSQLWDYAGTIIVEAPIGGILWLSPLVWFMLALKSAPNPSPANALTSPGRFSATTRWRTFAALTFALAVLVAVFDGEGAGILPRYVLDFTMPLLVSGAVGFMLLSVKGRSWTPRVAILMILVGVLVFCAVALHPNLMRPTWEYDLQVMTCQLNYLLFG